MNTKLSLPILGCIVIFTLQLHSVLASEVAISTAKNVAMNIYTERFVQGSSATVIKMIEEKEKGETVFYIMVYATKGFAIISADDAVRPVLGYSFESVWNENDHSPAFEFYILERFRKQIYAVKQSKQIADQKTLAEWEHYCKPPEFFQPDNTDDAVPLVYTLWGQRTYYNAMCPADPAGPDGHALVGCVATAMAQVLNYWQHPWHGTGSHSYTPEDHPEYGVQSADFSSAIYNFDNMPDVVTTYSDDLAELMYHCAVSVDMNFGPNGSGASGWSNNDISHALETWFYFNDAVNDLNRSSYLGELWPDLLKEDLDLYRPIVYGALDNQNDVGHTWVIDAYTSGNMFHCNWGWSGADNGWFSIDNFSANGHTFDVYETACVHIFPQTSHVNGTWDLSGSPYNLNYDYYVDAGDQLTIEPGVEINFTGRYKLEVKGRIVAQGTETDSIFFTSGLPEIGTRGVSFDNTNNYAADSSILRYCSFEHGKGKIISYFAPDLLSGGTIYCENSSKVTISNCLITGSSASYGGGIGCFGGSNISIANCVIENNTAESHGGGIYMSSSNAVLSSNLIQNNTCSYSNGGGVYISYSDPTLFQDTIRHNNSQFGGGIGFDHSDALLEEVVIHDNSANVNGGGLYMAESSPDLSRVHLFNNAAEGLGGAMLCWLNSNPHIDHTLINNNSAHEGAAMAILSSNSDLNHVTMASNAADIDGAAVYLNNGDFNLQNSILWNNFDDDIDTSGICNVLLTYSIVQHGNWTGTGVLKSDPLFSDLFISDYHLRWDGFPLPDENKSPAIDTGDPGTPLDPDGTRADMGVYPFGQIFTTIAGGNINGTLTCDDSPYYVTGNLVIPATDELVLEPCVSLIFKGDYRLEVRGRLVAEGTESSRINFASADTVTGWQGIRFINTNSNGQDSSYLRHCRITFGNADGSGEYAKGGALYFSSSKNTRVDHCLINKNKATSQGGAVYIGSTFGPMFTENRFENNYAPNGGALYGIYTAINLTDNLIQYNKANKGGGICVHTSHIYSSGNTIRYNRAENYGGGLYIVEHGDCSFDLVNKSNIYLNYAAAAGLDLFFTGNASYVKQIVVDTFSVQTINEHFAFPLQNFNITSTNSMINQESSDLYIDMEGSDYNTGTSPVSPLKTMYMACMKIMADAGNPRTIHLAEGTYSEGATGEVFPVNWRDYVSLKGAGIEETIIYGEEKNQLLYCYHDDGFTIDSLTFQGGYGEYGGAIRLENHSSPYITKVEIKDNIAAKHGGGIYCKDYSSPYIYDIKVHDNTVDENGGGIMIYCYCNPTIVNSMIYDNFALYNGGGIACQLYCYPYFDSLTIYQNTAIQGAGLNFNFICGGSVNNSLIQGNDALTQAPGYSGAGGGVWVYYISSPNFNNVTFKQNYAQSNGGGVYAYAQTYSVYKNCIFESNTANSGGAAYLYGANHHFYNTVFSNNSTVNGSGGAIASNSGSPTFTNVTIAENSANGTGNGGALYNFNSFPQFTNSILWDNSPEEIVIGSGSVTVEYSNIEGSFPGTGNINEDPMFEWTYNGQYDLGEGSPCIDAGNPDTTGMSLPLYDYAGNLRIVNNRVDMGAFENQYLSDIHLDLKIYLEGPFNGSGMNTDLSGITDFPEAQPYTASPWNYPGSESVTVLPEGVVDWILVELRDAESAEMAVSSARISMQAAFVMSDGNIRGLDGASLLQFEAPEVEYSLFTVISHRNHLAVICAEPLSGSGVFSCDFTTGPGQAYNNGQKEIAPGVWAMYSADMDGSGLIDPVDKTSVWILNAGKTGYLGGDADLNTITDNKDKNDHWFPNLGQSTQVPE